MCGKPAFINRTKIDPAVQRPHQIGVVEDFDYMACMGLFAEGFGKLAALVVPAAINAELGEHAASPWRSEPAFARRLRDSISCAFVVGHDAYEQKTLGRGA